MWKVYAAIGAAASAHAGTMMTARNQRAPKYAGDLNLSDIQGGNISANLNNSPYYERLAMLNNQYNQAENLSMLEQAMPGYAEWSAGQSRLASQYAAGGMSSEQAANIQRKAYEGSYSSGIRGQSQQFRTARDFGLAQLENAQFSQSIMQQLVALGKVNLSGVGNFYTTTQDAIATAMSNKQAEQAWLNAKQAADNVRRNALWASSSAWAATNNAAMGGSNQGSDINAWKGMNYAYQNNTY